MKVVRSHHQANYTIIPNDAIRDESLSRNARSILFELLSNPSGWPHATAEAMWKLARKQRGDKAEGRRAHFEAFNELVEAGYMAREVVRRGASLVTLVTVYDTPRARPDGSGRSGRGRSGSHRTNTRSTGLQRNSDEGGPSGSVTPTSKEAPTKKRDGLWDLLARIPDRLLLSPEADRATLGHKAQSLLRAGLSEDQLRALLSGIEGLGRPFGALLLRMASLKNALAFLDGKLGQGVHSPWGSATAWPAPGEGFGAGSTRLEPTDSDQGDAFAHPPEFDVDVNGAVDRTCPEHPTVRNVPGGCCALCGRPCRSSPGEILHPPAERGPGRPGPRSDRPSRRGTGLVPAPRPGRATDRAAEDSGPVDAELDPGWLERMLRSLNQEGRRPLGRLRPGEGAPPGRAGVGRDPGVARAGADRVRQALARVGVTTGGGPGDG